MTPIRPRWSAAEPPTVRAVAGYVLLHPWRVFIIDWNWKTALLSAIFRLALWPAMALRMNILSAGSLRGAFLEFWFRLAIGGFWGSLLQAFSAAQPAWLASLVVILLMPACVHALEYLVLRAAGTPHSGTATVVSIAFSMASLLVNWCLMRRGILVTGEEAAPLKTDLRRIFGFGSLQPAEESAADNSGGPAA
jgi:hypothetical protein